MEAIKPTRSELLRIRKRIRLARKGHDLLKRKQDALIMELFLVIKDVRRLREELQGKYAVARTRMSHARALSSDLTIAASAMAAVEQAPLQLQVRNVAGVRLPAIQRIETSRTSPVWDSVTVQDVGEAYVASVDAILLLAAKETALRRLLFEIEKVKRRAHALEHRVIPEMTEVERRIRFSLEERSREEFTRLKRRKHA